MKVTVALAQRVRVRHRQGKLITRAIRSEGDIPKALVHPSNQVPKQTPVKMPEPMDDLGFSAISLIQKHFIPLLYAIKKQVVLRNGKVQVTDVPDYRSKLKALDLTLMLRGAYPPRNPKEDEQKGVKIICVDIPGSHGEFNQFIDALPPSVPPFRTRS